MSSGLSLVRSSTLSATYSHENNTIISTGDAVTTMCFSDFDADGEMEVRPCLMHFGQSSELGRGQPVVLADHWLTRQRAEGVQERPDEGGNPGDRCCCRASGHRQVSDHQGI